MVNVQTVILFNKENRSLTDTGTDVLLTLTASLSWLLFPIMLKFLAYVEFQVVVLVISICVFLILIRFSKRNDLNWSAWHKRLIAYWAIYLFFLLIATVFSGDLYSLKQYGIVVYKALFLCVLLLFMKKKFIAWSFELYARLTLAVVVMAILVAIVVAIGVLDPVKYLTDIVSEQGYKFSVYPGAYYLLGQVKSAPFLLYRLQGFCEEPGTFAFVILPAMFWFLIVKKDYYRGFIIGLGLVGSFSLGVMLTAVLFFPIFWKRGLIKNGVGISFLGIIVIMFATKYFYLVERFFLGEDLHIMMNHPSYTNRVESIKLVYDFLSLHFFGTGNALGMMTVDYSISVGYANAVLESGVVGGLAYLLMFGLLGWKALELSLSVDIDQNEGRVHFVVAITVLVVLFMGLQRQQPDLSMWHMWIYASFIYLTMKKKGDDATNAVLK